MIYEEEKAVHVSCVAAGIDMDDNREKIKDILMLMRKEDHVCSVEWFRYGFLFLCFVTTLHLGCVMTQSRNR